MKCNKCGTEFEDNFCPACGSPADNVPIVEKNVSKTEKKKKPFYKRWWFIVIAIILVLRLFNVFLNNSDENKPEKFKWASFTLHDKLPEPKSNLGESMYDASESLRITVCNVSKSDYNDYVDKCENEFGYITDKSKSSTTFDGTNEENYRVTVTYWDEHEKMTIDLALKKDDENKPVEPVMNENATKTAENSTTQNNTTDISTPKTAQTESNAAPQTENKSQDANLADGMRKNFKEAMDSYEKFMDEYVAFMKKYQASDGKDLSIISDYADYMKKYAEMCEKFAKWEDEEMNSNELAYYIDVQARVSKKLLEVSYQ